MYGRNPFEEEDDEYSFASKARKKNAITTNRGGPKLDSSKNPFEDEEEKDSFENRKNNPVNSKQMLLQNSMNRQLESTTRILATIYDTEAIGISTAEELINQGEKLDNVERNVDKINEMTKDTQKHLNSIKSVFGSFKNWLSGDGKKSTSSSTAPTTTSRDRSNSSLSMALSTSIKDDHPALKSKSCVKGFYDADVVEFKDYDDEGFVRSGSRDQVSSRDQAGSRDQASSRDQAGSKDQLGSPYGTSTKASSWNEYEKGLDNNLNLMSNGLNNLKNLALGLNDEIDTQNKQLDRINTKVDRSDAKIRNQNLQMNRILGK